MVALDGADAHLGDDLEDALGDRLAVLLLGRFCRAADDAEADLIVDGLESQVRVHGARAVADQQGEMMDFTGLAGFEDQRLYGFDDRGTLVTHISWCRMLTCAIHW